MKNIPPTAKEFSEGRRIFVIYLASILSGIVLASHLSYVYIYLFRPLPYGSLLSFDVDSKNILDGFIIGYSFALSLVIAIFITVKKHQFWTWFFGMVVFLLALLYDLRYLGFVILVSLIGYSIGLGILYLKNRIVAARRTS